MDHPILLSILAAAGLGLIGMLVLMPDPIEEGAHACTGGSNRTP